jgi:hypothetical protein
MKKAIALILTFILIFSLVACTGSQTQTTTGTNKPSVSTTVSALATQAVGTTGAFSEAASVALAENSQTHDKAEDYTWDGAAVIPIALNGNSITANGTGVLCEREGSRTFYEFLSRCAGQKLGFFVFLPLPFRKGGRGDRSCSQGGNLG